MPDRQVAVDVKAKVSGADDVKALGTDVDRLTKKPAVVEVDAKVNPAIDRALGKLTELDEQARATAVAAQALGDAMGPELAGRANMDAVIAELKRAGLTIEEITANADQFGDKLKSIDSDDLGGRMGKALGTAKGQTEELADSARGANSALANMVGNSAQDLGALSGVAGSAGVALGQMAEYASDAALGGEALTSSLLSMAPVVGIVAALGLAFKTLSDSREADAAAAQMDEERVQSFLDQLKRGQPILDAYRESIEKTGQLKFAGFGDLVPQLDELNIGIDTFNQLASQSPDKVREWVDAQKALGGTKADMTALFDVSNALVTTQKDADEATRRFAASQKVLGTDTAAYTAMLADQEVKLNASTAATAAYAQAQQAAADQSQRVADILTKQADALNAQVDAATSAADAQLAENNALDAFSAKLGDAKATTDEVRDAAIGLAKAHEATAAAQAEATGQTLTATQKLDSLNEGLLTTAATAKGPARQSILDYIGSVNQIPPEKVTEIQAAIDAGDLDTAKRLLDEASAPRDAAIQADANTAAANSELNNTANPNGRPRTALINAQLNAVNWVGGGISGGVGGGPRSMPLPPDDPDGPAGLAAPAAEVVPAGFALESSGPTGVIRVAAPAPTVNVTVSAAVIGSRFEVVRAVRRATRDAVRLVGARP